MRGKQGFGSIVVLSLATVAACASERTEQGAEAVVDERAPLDIALPPEVRIPLDGLAEIEIALRGDHLPRSTQILADAAVPGLAAVRAAIPRFERVGVIRVGARAPLALGATFTLRVTASAGSRTGTAETRATVVAPSGALDPSFGQAGTFVASSNKYDRGAFTDLALEADGSILAAGPHGDIVGAVFRAVHAYADGTADPWSPDPSRPGTSGGIIIRRPEGPRNATALAIRRQSSGRVVVVGVDHRGGRDRIVVVGLRPQGWLDASFGVVGLRFLAPEGEASACTLALDAEDAIVVAGRAGRHALVARLLPDGAPDPRFGDGGFAVLDPLRGAASEVRSVAVDGAGRVLAAGDAGARAFLVQLEPDGTERWRFRLGRELPTPEPSDLASARRVVIAPGGDIVVGGVVQRGASTFVAVWRISADGVLDPRFGGLAGVPGLTVAPVFGTADAFGGIALAPDGGVWVALDIDARAYGDTTHVEPFLLHLGPDGRPDPGSGSHGLVRVGLARGNAVTSIACLGDGALLLGLRLRPTGKGGQCAGIARVFP